MTKLELRADTFWIFFPSTAGSRVAEEVDEAAVNRIGVAF
jgi:hypothetical protein